MLSCHDASKLLSDRLDRRLGPAERLALRIHLALCRGCSLADRQLDFLRKAMSEFGRRADRKDAARK